MYRIVPLCDDHKPVEGYSDCYVEGQIELWTVVSVPELTSQRSMAVIKNTLQERLNKPVMVISHNVTFLKAVKLTPNEAAKIIKAGEDYGEAYSDALQAKPVDQDGDLDGDGRGPGTSIDGDRNSEQGSGPRSGVPASEGDSDGKGEAERSAGPPGNSGRFA